MSENKQSQERPSLFTHNEAYVLHILHDALNEFYKLDILNSSDKAKFSDAIRTAQLIVLSRPATRDLLRQKMLRDITEVMKDDD